MLEKQFLTLAGAVCRGGLLHRAGRLFILAGLVIVCVLGSPAASEAAGGDDLKADIMLLKQENRRLRSQMALIDSLVEHRLQGLDSFNAGFNADVRSLNERLAAIEQRLDDIEKKVSRMAARSVTAAVAPADSAAQGVQPQQVQPKVIFDLAYKDFTASNFRLSIDGFLEFLSRYPDSPLAPEAYLYIGDGYRSLKKFQDAITHYKQIVDKYPDSPLHADALYKIGDCLITAGDRSRGEIFLQALIQKFPDTKAAAIARTKLNP
ncbi:MAG: tetratricopeptide repeat protein [Gemmatimonadota bacterium]|nr:tetratricopeptide repeat protein [Gemmatimonadota bacterium]